MSTQEKERITEKEERGERKKEKRKERKNEQGGTGTDGPLLRGAENIVLLFSYEASTNSLIARRYSGTGWKFCH